MIPRWFKEQDKFDVVNDVMLEVSKGKIERHQIKERISFYIGEANKMFAPKFRKFGDSSLVSLDEVLFDDGSTTKWRHRQSRTLGLAERKPPVRAWQIRL